MLVTGASTGIGRKITERLAAEGYFVYAGARKEEDLRELDAIENVDSVRLDVTSRADIAAAAEMAPLEVKVSLVEPGNYRSEIGRNAEQRLGVTTPLADRSKYPEPDAVAAAVLHSLSDATPRRRYLVVPIQALVQLNEGQSFSYDRKALVEMLDAELAQPQAPR